MYSVHDEMARGKGVPYDICCMSSLTQWMRCYNSWTPQQVLCQGGLFQSFQKVPLCNKIPTDTGKESIIAIATVLALVLFANGWLIKNYVLHDRLLHPLPTDCMAFVYELGIAIFVIVPGAAVFFARRHKKQLQRYVWERVLCVSADKALMHARLSFKVRFCYPCLGSCAGVRLFWGTDVGTPSC